MSKQITEADTDIIEKWYTDATSQTLETLPAFLKEIMNYQHDYGTICKALGAGSVATAWAMNKHPQADITGFQAGAVMWEFIVNWSSSYKDKPLKLINYEKMLYPQYSNNFEKTISQSTIKDHTSLDRLPEKYMSQIQTMLNNYTGVVSLEVFNLENLNLSLTWLSKFFFLRSFNQWRGIESF